MSREPQKRCDDPLTLLILTVLYFAAIYLPAVFSPFLFSSSLWIQVLVPSFFIYMLVKMRPVRLGLARFMTLGGIVFTILAVLTFYVIIAFIISPIWSCVFVRSASEYERTIETAMRDPFSFFVQVCVVAPIAEEIFFRGYLLPNVLERYGAPAALVLSTALFSILHFNLYQIASVALLGAILGILFLRTGTVRYPILFHFLHNTISFLILFHHVLNGAYT